jgi:hypothetical protein
MKPNTTKQKEFYEWRNNKQPIAFSYEIINRHKKKYIVLPKEVLIPIEVIDDLVKEIKKDKKEPLGLQFGIVFLPRFL